MANLTLLRRRFLLLSIGSGGLLAGCLVWAQANPPLTSKWSPGAVPGGGGIAVAADPIVTGEPFTAENNSRMVMLRKGEKVSYESHSIIARDSLGRVATRTPASPHVQFPDGEAAGFIPAGGTIQDPAARVQLRWADGDLPSGKVVLKNRMLPSLPPSGRHRLNACEREKGQTRHLRNGETRQVEDLGERTIQGILTEGCRVTTFIPAGTSHNDQPITTTDESWVSPELRITLLQVIHNSSGQEGTEKSNGIVPQDSIAELDNIVLGEPDPSLFEPPPDYEVRDMDAERERQEQAEFTVQPGQPDAEMLAGAWETDDPFAGKPAQMGIMLKLVANRRVPFQQGKVTGDGPQKFLSFDIRLYERAAGEDQGGWFSTSNAGGASWDGNRLRIEFHGAGTDTPFIHGDIALDLSFNQQKGFWTGNYTRGNTSKPVQLTRPGAASKATSNSFLGAWSETSTMDALHPALHQPTCVHIAQGSDGILVSWGVTRLGPIVDRREEAGTALFQEIDGGALGVEIDGDTLTLQEGIHSGAVSGHGPQRFIGKLSPDGTQIVGTWAPHAPESSGVPSTRQDQSQSAAGPVTTFARMTGQGCWSQRPNL